MRPQRPAALRRAPAATESARLAPAATSAGRSPAGLRRRGRDRFRPPRTGRSPEPRSPPASCRHIPARDTRVRSGAGEPAGLRAQSHACSAPRRCRQRDREAVERLNAFRPSQAPRLPDNIERPGPTSGCASCRALHMEIQGHNSPQRSGLRGSHCFCSRSKHLVGMPRYSRCSSSQPMRPLRISWSW